MPGCKGGCGASPDTFRNTCSVATHELVEAVSDPDVGLVGAVNAYPLGWYDNANNAEIGDLCNAQEGSVNGYTVQLMWSNKDGKCVAM
ncbi:hypothetical protein HDU76_004751 [Blyttiomyces sp. JEL0837]|nr:hypothetical protein HDU76_004751 [Blyttiomyces sp. JEL0837]